MAVGGGCWSAAPSRRCRPPPTAHDARRAQRYGQSTDAHDQRRSRDVTARNVKFVIARQVECARGARGAGAIVDGRAAAGDRHRCTLWSRAATTVPIDERARARVLFFIQSLNKMVVGLLCLLYRREGSTDHGINEFVYYLAAFWTIKPIMDNSNNTIL